MGGTDIIDWKAFETMFSNEKLSETIRLHLRKSGQNLQQVRLKPGDSFARPIAREIQHQCNMIVTAAGILGPGHRSRRRAEPEGVYRWPGYHCS
jgi:hypothetical protein